jgi:hypothetical protein
VCAKSQSSDYSVLDHILRAAYLSRSKDAWVIFVSKELAAYFDDSGHPDDQDVVLVAGWVGNVDQWILWEQGWKKVLSDFGIKTDYFHMTDFQAAPKCKDDQDNPYKHLSTHQRQVFLYRLLNHIATRVRYSFSILVPMHDYREVNEIYYLEEWLGKPYTIAALSVVQKLKAWKDKYAPDDPLEVFVEDGTKHKGDLRKVFKQFHYEEPIFKDKKKVAPLQAADLLAWENFHMFKHGVVRASYQYLAEHTVGHEKHGIFTTRRLIEACEEEPLRVPKRDPNDPRKFRFNAEPKVSRMRQIKGPPREGQVKGLERVPRPEDEGIRFLLGVDDISDLIRKK